MTDKEKLKLIKKLCLNFSPIDFNEEKWQAAAGHCLCCAIECVCEMEDEDGK